jgi:hypothetical protein
LLLVFQCWLVHTARETSLIHGAKNPQLPSDRQPQRIYHWGYCLVGETRNSSFHQGDPPLYVLVLWHSIPIVCVSLGVAKGINALFFPTKHPTPIRFRKIIQLGPFTQRNCSIQQSSIEGVTKGRKLSLDCLEVGLISEPLVSVTILLCNFHPTLEIHL